VDPALLPLVIADAVRSTVEGVQTICGSVIFNIGAVFTTIEIVFETVLTGLAHGSLLVIVTVTISPLFKVVVVKVDAICPATFTPLIFH
jgi:hypothetical protein